MILVEISDIVGCADLACRGLRGYWFTSYHQWNCRRNPLVVYVTCLVSLESDVKRPPTKQKYHLLASPNILQSAIYLAFMAPPTGAHIIVRSLRDLGVTVIFGVVGIPVVEIAEEAINLGIRFIAFRNEQAASYAASAYGYLTGRPGICLVVGGPGVLHGIAGVCPLLGSFQCDYILAIFFRISVLLPESQWADDTYLDRERKRKCLSPPPLRRFLRDQPCLPRRLSRTRCHLSPHPAH